MKLPFRPSATVRGAAEFYLPRPENLLLVQRVGDGGVIIRATEDNLAPEQQEAFIRYLYAEGFIGGDSEPLDRFHEHVLSQEGQPVRWLVDPSWPRIDPVYALHIQRLCWYTAGTMMVWLMLVAVLVCC